MPRLQAPFLVVLLGCGGGAAKPAPVTEPPPVAAEPTPTTMTDDELRAMFEEMVAIIERLSASSQKSCAELARMIDAEADGHRDAYDRFAQLDESTREHAQSLFDAGGYEERLDRTSPALTKAFERCARDTTFQRAAERFAHIYGGSAAAP